MKIQRIRNKKYSAESPESRRILIGGIGLMHALSIGCMVFFIVRFGVKEIYFWLLAMLFCGLLGYVDYSLYSCRLIYRSVLRYQFKEDGIHCSGLGIKKHVIEWDSIRTYGLGGVFEAITDQYGNLLSEKLGFSVFYFSQEANENFREKPLRRKSQMLLEYRKDAWEAATAYMPEDMKTNLEDCIRSRQDGFFQR